MSDGGNVKKTLARQEVGRAARAFFRSLGVADWLLLLAMFCAVTSAPTFYVAFSGATQGVSADVPDAPTAEFSWEQYWRILTFTLVYVSLAVYLLYLMNGASRMVGIPLVVLHALNAAFSAVCLGKMSWDHFTELGKAFQSQRWSYMVGSLASSIAVAAIAGLRLALDARADKQPKAEVSTSSPAPSIDAYPQPPDVVSNAGDEDNGSQN